MGLEKHREVIQRIPDSWFVVEPGLEPHFPDLYHHALSTPPPIFFSFSSIITPGRLRQGSLLVTDEGVA